jgi:GntP family gluconate:H+ symporter
MTPEDIRLLSAAVLGIGLAVVLILKGRLHPFIALLCGAFLVGAVAGQTPGVTAKAIQTGVGDILGGTGLVVALGLSLGAMLQISGGARRLAGGVLSVTGAAAAPWASLAAAMLVGLPLFFETGLVLLMPVIGAALSAMPGVAGKDRDRVRLQVMLPALAGLSVVHALVPPHPGPLLAVSLLGANLGRTMLYGLAVAIPTAIVSGPLLARFLSRGVPIVNLPLEDDVALGRAPPNWASALVVLTPVVLIAGGQFEGLLPAAARAQWAWLIGFSNPVLALLLTNLLALPLLFGRALADRALLDTVWAEAVKPAGAILLAIGAGGGLKQVLVGAGLSNLLAGVALHSHLSPLVLAWFVAVCIRLATGSATVATITAAGLMKTLLAVSGVSPEWMVLAIGAGSLFFSHVNDPGFWLVRGYLGVSTAGNFRTWSVVETVISVVGLFGVLCFSRLM